MFRMPIPSGVVRRSNSEGRRKLDLALMATGAAVLVTSTLLAKRRVYGWEVTVFQVINRLPGSIRPYLWVLNQYGTAVTILWPPP
jgi:hypothetical protein